MKTFKILAMLLVMAGASSAWAISAPAGLTATAITPEGSSMLSWNVDATASQWFIYLDGKLVFQPFKSQVRTSATTQSYLLQPLPKQDSVVVTMKALAPGQPISAESNALTVTVSVANWIYARPYPGSTFNTSGGGGGGGAVSGAVSVSAYTGGTIPVSVTSMTAGGAFIYSTGVTSANVPVSPTVWNMAGNAYQFAGNVTPTGGVIWNGITRLNYLWDTVVYVGVTAPANAATSLVFLTPSARTKTTIINNSGNDGMRLFLSNSPIIPANCNVRYRELPSSTTMVLDDHGYTYLWIWDPLGANNHPVYVQHESSNPWIGVIYPTN
jgi:hypothetical protein